MIYALFAFLAVCVLIPPVKWLAPKVGLVDAPDGDGGRKDHEGEIPLIGGLVLFPVFVVFAMIAGDGWASDWPLYSALGLLLLTGAVDDRVHLHSFVKFFIQFIAAALVVIPGGAELVTLGDLFGLGPFDLGFISTVFSIVSVVLLINAINLMDGLDGLAGGVTFVILGWFLFAALMAGEAVFSPSLMILMGALAGFLVYNARHPMREKASIFLGDAGSTCLGLMVGWYAIHLSQAPVAVIEPMAVAWVLAIPIWDECAQFNRRVREGRHPFSPDRGHFHHHFIAAGFAPARAVAMILTIVFLCGGFGVVGVMFGVPLAVLTVIWIIAILAHIRFSQNLENYPALIQKITNKN